MEVGLQSDKGRKNGVGLQSDPQKGGRGPLLYLRGGRSAMTTTATSTTRMNNSMNMKRPASLPMTAILR